MRTFILAIAFFVSSRLATAQSYLAEVVSEGTVLRAGPGDSLPDTGVLARGARLIVDHEEGDKWLAVEPPRGQITWIKNLHLGPVDGQEQDRLPRNAVVHADQEIDLAYGRPGSSAPLDVRRNRIPDGTIVLVIGPSVMYQNTKWVPIDPPEGDFRYVLKSSVRTVRGRATEVFTVKSPTPEPMKAPEGDFSPAASIPNGNRTSEGNRSSHPLWVQAETAEASGDLERAESLYLKLAAEMNRAGGDVELANLCFSRVHQVREKQRKLNSGGRSRVRGEETVRTRRDSTALSTQSGVLRTANFRYEGRQVFALDEARGKVRCYCLAGPGVDLERFVGREVEVSGTMSSSRDLNGVGLMTVSQIQPPREK